MTLLPSALESQNGSGLFCMLAEGLPISRILEAAVTLAARSDRDSRCAILIVKDDRFVVAAKAHLSSADKRLLNEVCSQSDLGVLEELGNQQGARIMPLVTYAAELIGALVVFGSTHLEDEHINRQLQEVCAMATVAIEQSHLAEELAYRARHDPLTHLWNRLWIEDEILRSLDASLHTGRSTGLILLGVDSFRLINDVLGLQAGNELLRQIAVRLLEALGDNLPLARGSGDEFLILLPELSSTELVSAFASRLLARFDRPFEIANHELLIRASIGTAVAAPGELSAEDLQNRSNTALRYAKRHARGRALAYTTSMSATPVERLVMEKHLRFALQKREFEVHYQPQIELASGNLTGVEALLRWRHSSLGLISPAVFVPIAEEIGIIDEIGDWVLGEAVRQLDILHSSGLNSLRMAVNVSALQFGKTDFAASVAKRLRTARTRPRFLELEITESVLMTDLDHGLRQFKLLHSLGVLTALDDFGTGHSSLAYLQQLPVHRLKIDRMFVKDITSREDRPPLLATIIQMGHALGHAVIAEGVETVEQMLVLSAMQCDEIQGYFFSKALPPMELLSWEKARSPVRIAR